MENKIPTQKENPTGLHITGEQIIEALDAYVKKLYKDPKVSAIKYRRIQTALFGAKQFVREAIGINKN